MSYSLTIDAPERVTRYVERRGPRFKAMLGSMFVAFVATEMQNDEGERTTTLSGKTFSEKWRAVVDKSNGRLDAPYKFNRSDAYPEGEFA